MHIVKSTPTQSAESSMPAKAANDELLRVIAWPAPRPATSANDALDPPDDYALGGYAGI